MILGDGLIGQMMEPVEFPDHLKTVPTNKDEWATNGMGNRGALKPNLVKSLYLDPQILNDHNLLLKSKYERMKKEEIRFESYNKEGNYRALIVSFGTMSRVCRTAIDNLKEEGIEVAMIRPQTLFPFPEKAIYDAAAKESCKIVLSIEMNMGQMVEDVERCLKGSRPVQWYGKCGGEVPTPEEIMDVVKEYI
jgi:2-oxoglutarate ferredoxin oxidoreductase subunit alpha